MGSMVMNTHEELVMERKTLWDPRGSLGSQYSIIGEFQANVRPCLKKRKLCS